MGSQDFREGSPDLFSIGYLIWYFAVVEVHSDC